MTMYASQKRNLDERPWRDSRGMHWTLEVAPCTGEVRTYAPRPEFDNNPNPALLAFREAVDSSTQAIRHDARLWLHLHLREFVQLNGLDADTELHARRVLERLARAER